MPEFDQYDTVKHRATNTQGVVLRKFVDCDAPKHVALLPVRGRVLLCDATWGDDGTPIVTTPHALTTIGYEVSFGTDDVTVCAPGELDLVAKYAPPPLATQFRIDVSPADPAPDPGPTVAAVIRQPSAGPRELREAHRFPTQAAAIEWCRGWNVANDLDDTFATLEEHAGIPVPSDKVTDVTVPEVT